MIDLKAELSISDDLQAALDEQTRLDATLADVFVAGVSSWNGLSGDVEYTAPVTSVNGQTGDVTVSTAEALIGTTDEITPTQVYNAVSTGLPISLTHHDEGYGNVTFTNFDIIDDLDYVISTVMVYTNSDNGVYHNTTLIGNNDGWEFWVEVMAKASSIPTVPTDVSAFNNDANYITAAQAPVQSVNGQTGTVNISIPVVPTNISSFNNDAGYATETWVGQQGYLTSAPVSSVNGQTGAVVISVPTKTSDLNNDSNYITAAGAPVQSVNGQTGSVVLSIPTVPTNVSAFNNDAGYLTLSDLPIYGGEVS